MEKPVFPDKKVLILYPTDYGNYKERFTPLKAHFKDIEYLNYSDVCTTIGPVGLEKQVLELIKRDRPDLVLCCFFASDHPLSVEFISTLRNSVAVLFWFADDATYFEAYSRYYAQAADVAITADDFAMQAYRRLEIPSVYCPEIVINNKLFPMKIDQDIDVLFVGDVSKRGRTEYLDHLRNNGIEPVVYGQRSPNGYLPFDKVSEYFCRSKIVLNFCQIGELNWINNDEPLLNRVRQNPGRPREVALARGFCLSEYSPYLETSFKIGEEMDVFRDKDELLEKVRYYLANPEHRHLMAEKAWRRADPAYRVPNYIAQTLQAVSAVLAAGRPRLPSAGRLFLSSAFKAKAINYLTFICCTLLVRRRFSAAALCLPQLFRYGPLAFLRGVTGGAGRSLALMARKIKLGRTRV